MYLWIPITIAAAFFQNVRFMLQKQLKDRLSTLGVTLSRFLFAAPFGWILVLALLRSDSIAWPGLTPAFLFYGAVGGLCQIFATALLIALFSYRNFAVGVTFVKTETVMTAILSGLMLGEFVSRGGTLAIFVTVIGVILMSGTAGRNVLSGLISRPALLGISSGLIFALASVAYRAATLSLETGDFLIRSAVALAIVTTFQTAVMAVWLVIREPGQITEILRNWRICIWVGLTGMLGTLGWFSAFTLQNAAYVKALGQIELVFSLAASHFFFGERSTRAELAGMALVVAGIVLLLLL
jgi:drug/metabolite transporter (DMT)-like permease